MYYIDAIESEISLFDFPGVSPATESAESAGEKFRKILKFIAKKIKEFVRKLIALIKALLGNNGQYKALSLKDKAIDDIRNRLKSLLPDKEVTDLTKIRGLSSYQGGDTPKFITDSQYNKIIQACDKTFDMIIKSYTSEVTSYDSALSDLIAASSSCAKEVLVYTREAQKAIESGPFTVNEFNTWLQKFQSLEDSSKSQRSSISSIYNTNKSKIAETARSIINNCSNDLQEDMLETIKDILNSYATRIKISIRDGNKSLMRNIKFCEEIANNLAKNADIFEKLSDLYTSMNNVEWQRATSSAAKVNLSYSQALYSTTALIKNSSSSNIFSESN